MTKPISSAIVHSLFFFLTGVFISVAAQTNEEVLKKAQQETEEAKVLINNPQNKDDLEKAIEKLRVIQKIVQPLSGEDFRTLEATALRFLGVGYSRRDDHSKALAMFNQELALQISLQDKAREAKALLNIAFCHQNLNEPQKAGEYFNLALPIFKALNDKAQEISIEGSLGLLLYKTGNYEEALNKYNVALTYYRETKNQAEEARYLNLIGVIYTKIPEKQSEAPIYMENALRIYKAIGYKKGEMDMQNNLALFYSRFNMETKALELYFKSLAFSKETNNPNAEAAALTNIGGIYGRLGENYKALEVFDRALAINRKIENKQGEAKTLKNIGDIYSNLGQEGKAIENYNAAINISRILGDKLLEAGLRLGLGHSYSKTGEYLKAIENHNLALDIFRLLKLIQEEAIVLDAIGAVYSDLKDYKKAAEYFDQALSGFEKQKLEFDKISILNNYGNLQLDLKDAGKALEYYEKGLAIYRNLKVKNPLDEFPLLTNSGLASLKLNRTEEAENFLNKAVLLTKFGIGKREEAIVLYAKMVQWKKTSPTTAIFFGKLSVNTFQAIISDINSIGKDTARNYLKTIESVYRELTEILIKEKRYEEAQEILSLFKEIEFQETFRRIDKSLFAESNSKASLTANELKVLEKYTNFSVKPEKNEPEFYRFLNELPKEFETGDKAANTLTEMPASVTFRENLKALNASTKSNVVGIYTLSGEENYYVLLVTPTKIFAGSTPIKQTDLIKKIELYRKALQNPASNPQPLASELFEILLKPVIREIEKLKADTLMWSLDGNLRYIPPAALFNGEKQEYLVQKYRNVMFTNALTAGLFADKIEKKSWRGLGAGVSEGSNIEFQGKNISFSALPQVLPEIRGIIRETNETSGIYQGVRLENKNFTRAKFQNSLKTGFQFIHLAGHFYFDHKSPLESFLLLGDNTKLNLSEIQTTPQIFQGVELLTLSACETAQGGEDSAGREIEGFAILAQRQGAKSILATLWKVNDENTGKLMKDFYNQLNTPQMNKAEALRQAQLNILTKNAKKTINTREKFSHPFYWSSFVLVGDWQ